MSLCSEHETDLLIIHHSALTQDFFHLKTRVAGNMIQKLLNYGIRTAIIIPEEIIGKGRFKEMTIETNNGQHFRIYDNKKEAENWLQNI